MSTKLKELTQHLKQLKTKAIVQIEQTQSSYELDQIKSKYIGKKSELASILKEVSVLSNEDKPIIGKEANILKNILLDHISKQKVTIQDLELTSKLTEQKDDVTLPSLKAYNGHFHPISLTIKHLVDLFGRLGFSVKKGPDIESDFYNFEAFNIDGLIIAS